MQFEGGYRYPSNIILIILSMFSIALTTVVWYQKCLSQLQTASLFLGLEGTSLLASSYSPVGLSPPQGNLWLKFKWFLKPQKGITVRFNHLTFYGGLIFLFLSYFFSAYSA
jgi:hypothetical protein